MQILNDLLGNFPVMMALIAWFSAQVIKLILTFIFCREEFSLSVLVASGGMPSSHSATVCALTTAIVLTEGVGSVAFAISAVLSFVVMYDARGVRRSAGEQAQKLNDIILHLSGNNKNFNPDDTVREILGHTPLQVTIGALLGVCIPILVYFVF
jgi:acid phosphatase family membrane protein YuiD